MHRATRKNTFTNSQFKRCLSIKAEKKISMQHSKQIVTTEKQLRY